MDLINKMCSRIIYVNNKGVKITGNFSVRRFRHMYAKCETNRLFLEEDLIIHDNKAKVCYNCSCGNKNEILLIKFLKKETDKCKKCLEDENKRKRQSEYMKETFAKNGKVVKKENKINNLSFKKLKLDELIIYSDLEFNKKTDDFKKNYFEKNLTIDEYEKIKNKVGINGKLLSEYVYLPHIATSTTGNFSSKVLDKNGNTFLLYNVEYKCDSCEKKFGGRYIKKRANDYKILCKDCCLCNKKFKIREIKNIKGETIKYQSMPELDLIKFCEYNGILINNGPYINYNFDGKEHVYRVDFKINKLLIEIKDDHIWHRNQVESGKWEQKEKSAIDYCKENHLEYRLIMKKDLKTLKDYIIRYFHSY